MDLIGSTPEGRPAGFANREIHQGSGFDVLLQQFGEWGEVPGFLLWRKSGEPDANGKFAKIPFDPDSDGGRYGSPWKVARFTLAEAVARARALSLSGLNGGVGMVASKVGLLAGDLDGCFADDGELVPWAAEVLGTSPVYVEKSPSGGGLRFVMPQPEGSPIRMTGGERNGVGLYGADTQKFVTLTGWGASGGLMLDPDMVNRAVSRMAEGQGIRKGSKAHKERVSRLASSGDLYPHGREGMAEALADLREGRAIHPAIVGYMTRACYYLPISEAEENCRAAYLASPLRETEPARWWARSTVLDKFVGWIKDRGDYRRDPIPTQDVQAAKAVWERVQQERFKPEVLRTEDERPKAPIYEGVASASTVWAYRGGALPAADGQALARAYDLTREELADMDEWDVSVLVTQMELDAGNDPTSPDLAALLQADTEAEEREAEREAGLAKFRAVDMNDPDRHRWMLDELPGYWTRRIADYLADAMQSDMPGAAALGALVTMSTLAANRYFARVEHPDGRMVQDTGLNLYGAVSAPTAGGKDALFRFIQDAARVAGCSYINNATSEKALHRKLSTNRFRAVAMVMDEWANVLQSRAKDQSGHKVQLDGFLLNLYGSALLTSTETAYAQEKNDLPELLMPYLVSFGVTTGGKLDKVLTRDMVSDGTANRTILLDAERGTGKRRYTVRERRVDRNSLLGLLGDAFGFRTFTGLPAELKATVDLHMVQEESNVPGAMPEDAPAVRLASFVKVPIYLTVTQSHKLDDAQFAMADALDDELKPISGRLRENAIKVAALLRLGEFLPDFPPERLDVTDAQVDYAIRFMSQILQEMAHRFATRVAAGPGDEILQQIRTGVVRLMDAQDGATAKDRGARLLAHGLVTQSVLLRFARGLKLHEHRQVVDAMLARDWITPASEGEVKAVLKGAGRPPAAVYRLEPGFFT